MSKLLNLFIIYKQYLNMEKLFDSMEDIIIREYEEMNLSNAMLVIAFPTVGLVGPIAGHFIIDFLKLDKIGTIISKYFMPATVIHKSIPSPPVRIYAGRKVCGPDGSCEQVAIIISEFMPPSNIIKPLVDKILEWSDKKGCKIIVALEGTHAIGERKEKNLQIYGVGSTHGMKVILKNYEIEQTQEGMITGVTGVLLYEGTHLNRDVI